MEANDLLELVKKNKTIPIFFSTITMQDKRLLCLKKAICKGNFRAKIWNDKQCNLYLIYLIQEKIIPFWQGITAYVYLIAKMQYTQTQCLRAEDHDVKLNYQVEIVPLVKAGKITELGYLYLLGLMRAFEKINTYLNFDHLVKYVLELPPIERWLIKTEFNHHVNLFEAHHDSDRVSLVLVNNLPFIQNISGYCDDPTLQYLVPSSSLINYCLMALNEQPMRMRPVLGSLGLERLYQWHAIDFHPVSLYAPQVLSNPKEADGYRCGPFPMWLHDIGHTFWASMLSKPDRDYIFTTYIPALHGLSVIAEAYNDEASIERLNEIKKRAYDFDLTAILHYADVVHRLKIYLAHTFGKHPLYPICLYTGAHDCAPVGCAEGDSFYFLLHYALYSDGTPDAHKAVYQTLINFVTTGSPYRDQRCVNALKILAQHATCYPEALFARGEPLQLEIDYSAWEMLLNTRKTSETLWLAVTGDPVRAQELVGMIEQGLNFFHPYMPMTLAKREVFMKSLNQLSGNKISQNSWCYVSGVTSFQSTLFSHRHKNEASALPIFESTLYAQGLSFCKIVQSYGNG